MTTPSHRSSGIAALGRALPLHEYDQETLTRYLAEEVWSGEPRLMARLRSLHENVLVRKRRLALPLGEYAGLTTFGRRNAAWIECATDLGEAALADALGRAALAPGDIDALFFSTVTGLACPSIDARLANRMRLRADLKRIPLFGLGCVAGAAALARAADYVRAFPEAVAAVLTVELCSLTFRREDASIANLISSGLFGDGASAALVVGAGRLPAAERGPAILATRSVFYPDTEDAMGWTFDESGLGIVLSPEVPAIARERLGGDVDAFLAEHGRQRSEVGTWVCHPGGPKVLLAIQEALGARREDLAESWDHLAELGNLSSASVLMILDDVQRRRRPAPGTLGVLIAMGPGFGSELVLLRW